MKQILLMFAAFILLFIGYSFYLNRDFTFFDNSEFTTNDYLDQSEQTEDGEGQDGVSQVDQSNEIDHNTINEHEDIVVKSPEVNQIIESPLELSGEVRESWLFEASAPVVLTNWNGLIIAEGYIKTQDDWMTTDFVPFSGILKFEKPEDIGEFSDSGYLIFHKGNPSGESELDDS